MNTKNASYGSVSFNGNSYFAQFWNPITQSRVLLGSNKDKSVAEELLRAHAFKFYSENSWLLPKCISLNRRDEKYMFILPKGKKSIFYGQFGTLQEVVDAKMEFITKLI
jgi:hypothetical protein